MTKPKEVQDWLKNDPPQLKWAEEYLRKKGFTLPIDHGYETVLVSMNRLGKERLRLMRLAWNQHGSKAKRQRKTYSFTLAISTRQQLKRLATGRVSESSVLEGLIELGHNIEIEMKKEWRQAIQEKKAALDQRRPLRAVLSAAELKAQREAADLRKERDALRAMVEELSQKNAQLETLLEKGRSQEGPTSTLEAIKLEQPGRRGLGEEPSTRLKVQDGKVSGSLSISRDWTAKLEIDASQARLTTSEYLEQLIEAGLRHPPSERVIKPTRSAADSSKALSPPKKEDKVAAPSMSGYAALADSKMIPPRQDDEV